MQPDLKRLSELPDAQDPPYGYGEFSRRYSRRRNRQAQAPLRLLAVALAVVVAGVVMKHGLQPAATVIASGNPADARPQSLPQIVPIAAGNAERWLNAQPHSAIVRVPTQMAVSELEDQIAAMDDQLNAVQLAQPHPQQLAVLQRDRAQLVESLAQVRYAQILVAGVQ